RAELHVVVVERVGDDEVALAIDRDPVGQVVVIGIGIVEEAAVLDDQLPGIAAQAAGIPADRPHAAGLLDRLDCEAHVAALLGYANLLVVDPAPAMARHFMSGLDHRAAGIGMASK